MTLHRKTRVATAVAATFAFSLAPAMAAADADTQAQQRVLVTGSNIKRVEVETSDPVEILNRTDIERSGATTLAEFLKALVSASPSLQDVDGGTAFAGGASSVAMRHLDKQSTLVLLNGRRLAPFALADFHEAFTNIDTLPMSAIERVEILKNGASAVYGSDAVAGVINIITRQEYHGVEAGVSGMTSLTSHSFGEHGMHATAGFGDLNADHFNVLANLELYHRDGVMWRQVLDHMGPQSRALIPVGTGQYSPYSFPGNVGSKSIPGCDPAKVIGGLCMYDRYTRFEAQPVADRASLLVAARASLTPGLEGFAEFSGASMKTTYQFPYRDIGSGDSYVWASPTTGALQSVNVYKLPPTNPLNTTGDYADWTYRATDVPTQRGAASRNYRFLTGLRSNVGLYDWETAVSFLGSDSSQMSRGVAFSASAYDRLVGGTTNTSDPNAAIDPNYFNIPGGYHLGGPNSAAVLNALFPVFGSRGKLTQTAWDGKISSDLAQLAAGPLSFATGFELRHEHWTVKPTDNLLAGDIVNYGSSQTNAARSYGAVFGELDVPVVTAVDTQWAARVDKFPGLGAHVSPKVGLRFQPSKSLMLRSTVESGFRAPNLSESAPTRTVGFQTGLYDPQRCPQAIAYYSDLMAQSNALPPSDPNQTLLASRALQSYFAECGAAASAAIRDNPALRPEVSHAFTLGMLFEPRLNTTFTLDYWNIQRKGEIGILSSQDMVNQESALPPGVVVDRAPLSNDRTFTTPELLQHYGVTSGALQGVNQQFDNVSRTRTDGIDFGAKTRFGTPLGAIDTSVEGTYLANFQTYSTAKGGYGDNLAGRYGYSRLVATTTAALNTGSFVNGLKLTYHSGTTLNGDFYDTTWTRDGCATNYNIAPGDCHVGAYVLTDYFFSYNGFHNLTVNAHVGNLFARKPPFDRKAMEQSSRLNPTVSEVERRTLQVSVDYKFK